MKKYTQILSCMSLAFFLVLTSGCKPVDAAQDETPDIAKTAESIAGTMVAVNLTEIAKNSDNGISGKTPTQTDDFIIPTLTTVMPGVTPSPTSKVCLAASLVNEDLPDGSIISPGQQFTKTWYLRNIGNCPWTEDYSMVFHHGTKMTTINSIPFPGYVAPGETIPFSLSLVAPTSPGDFTSFWTLQDPNGNQFGPSANGVFWVRIAVPAATSLPNTKSISAIGWSVRSDGNTENNFWVGDNNQNLYSIAYGSVAMKNIPSNAILSSIILEMGGTYTGNPFVNLGCLRVKNAGNGALMWSICSFSQIQGGNLIYGDSASVSAGQAGILAGELLLELSFDNLTNNDKAPDLLKISSLRVTFSYNIP